jgi:hypothetical protein
MAAVPWLHGPPAWAPGAVASQSKATPMIRLPDVDPVRLPKPKPASRYEAQAEWTGPVDLGREAMLRDLALRRGWDLVDDDLTEHRFAAWTHEEDARFDEAVAALPPAEAKGFAERATRDVFEGPRSSKKRCRREYARRSTTASPHTSKDCSTRRRRPRTAPRSAPCARTSKLACRRWRSRRQGRLLHFPQAIPTGSTGSSRSKPVDLN